MLAPTIRLATPADIPAVTAIYAEAVANGTATFEIDPPDATEMKSRWRSLVDGGFPYFVAEDSGRVLGFAYSGPYRTRAAYRHTVEDSIYLDTAARGRGIGTALLTALIAETEKRGFRQMIAAIGDSENAASRKVHARCGFSLAGTFRTVGWKHGRWLDVVLMQRDLGQGARIPPPAGP